MLRVPPTWSVTVSPNFIRLLLKHNSILAYWFLVHTPTQTTKTSDLIIKIPLTTSKFTELLWWYIALLSFNNIIKSLWGYYSFKFGRYSMYLDNLKLQQDHVTKLRYLYIFLTNAPNHILVKMANGIDKPFVSY